MQTEYFVSSNKESQRKLRGYIQKALDSLETYHWSNKKAYNKAKSLNKFIIPSQSENLNKIIKDVGSNIVFSSVNLSHPKTIAYLHSLPTTASIVAELIIGATNQSLDSWEEGPSAALLEQSLVRFFCDLVGYGKNGDGILDAGGTMANQAAVLIARDSFLKNKFGKNAKKDGIPSDLLPKLKILCSEEAHFTIEKSASICGLGTDAVIKVPVNDELVMDATKLEIYVNNELKKGNYPFLIVATAGKTNSGNIPDLLKIGKIAKKNSICYHVDAAYGGALLFSKKYRSLLAGIEMADSITFDPHKMLWQPASCGLFLLADKKNFDILSYPSEYLNPESDAENGRINLVDKSLQTTRRFDALKLYMSLRHLGKKGYDKLITGIIDRTKQFASIISQDTDFELLTKPQTGVILFRYVDKNLQTLNDVNGLIQHKLYESGKAIINSTKIKDKVYLKISCMNPLTTKEDIMTIIKEIKIIAKSLN